MARCEQGYLCEVCGQEVQTLGDSDLYLRYILHEISPEELLSAPERHIRCNPTLAQFITADDFAAVTVEGPFSKSTLDPADVARREAWVTRGWQRLQVVQSLGIPIAEYPLKHDE